LSSFPSHEDKDLVVLLKDHMDAAIYLENQYLGEGKEGLPTKNELAWASVSA
jgi:hypothetical protein